MDSKVEAAGSGAIVKLSSPKLGPEPSASGFCVPPETEKSNSVTGPKLKVSTSFDVELTTKLTDPTGVPKRLAATVIVRPSSKAAAKSPLNGVNGVEELMIARFPGEPAPRLNATFGELVSAMAYP